MNTADAYAATSPTAPLRPMTINRRDLDPHDVLNFMFCGMCHSDLHHVRA